MPLLRKVWDAFPDYRSYVFGYIRGEAVWQYPEMYDYAVETVVPAARVVRARQRSGRRSTTSSPTARTGG